MHTSPTPSWPGANVTGAAEASSETSYQLLTRLPDLRSPASGPLGRLRVNWRRGSRARRGLWRPKGTAGWLGVAAAVLLVLAALLMALGPAQQDQTVSTSPVADSGRRPRQTASAPHAQSVVPAGYQTADSAADAKQTDSGPSLLTLRPVRLTGSIETVKTEGRW